MTNDTLIKMARTFHVLAFSFENRQMIITFSLILCKRLENEVNVKESLCYNDTNTNIYKYIIC